MKKSSEVVVSCLVQVTGENKSWILGLRGRSCRDRRSLGSVVFLAFW
jgi:hypothetical protein